jgi:cytochrome c oxidase subunit 2
MPEWLLPGRASVHAADIDWLFNLILVITGVVFIAVQATLIAFLIRYRRRAGRRAEYHHGSRNLELVWTGVTAAIVLLLAFLSRDLWLDIKEPGRFPDPGLEVRVVARQFEWNVTYPGADGRLGTADDPVSRNRLHVPVDVPVLLYLESEDVIHSLFVPHFRFKQDAVPGMTIPAWFQATRTGEYVIGCAELCGLGHYRMAGTLIVQTAADFAAWQRQLAAGGPPAMAAEPADGHLSALHHGQH